MADPETRMQPLDQARARPARVGNAASAALAGLLAGGIIGLLLAHVPDWPDA